MGVPTAARWASTPGNWDPLNAILRYEGDPVYGIPAVLDQPEDLPSSFTSWPNRRRRDPNHGLHFFVDDYRFEPLWKNPDRYAAVLLDAPLTLSPDFSVYADWPKAMQVWQVYRARWLCRRLQELGARVIPAVSWGGRGTYSFAFLGLPAGCRVAVTTVGRSRFPGAFDAGFRAMVRQVRPREAIVIGPRLPYELDATPTRYFSSDSIHTVRERGGGAAQMRDISIENTAETCGYGR